MAIGVVTTIGEKCRKCYTCIRNCPAKAIKVIEGQAKVIEERCIACGNCIKVCSQGAKQVQSAAEHVNKLLKTNKEVIAILAPSFPAAFPEAKPLQVVGATKKMGFSRVMEVAFGAEILGKEYYNLVKNNSTDMIITTPCPALVLYIEKYIPELIPRLAPIVSPMIAMGRVIKAVYNSGAKIVFVGPCLAKKVEVEDENVSGIIDAALTYRGFKKMLEEQNISIADSEEIPFDGPSPLIARIFPVSGGLLRTAALKADITENDILVVEGKDRVMHVLNELAENRIRAKFVDILFCEGCVNGPMMENELSFFSRKEIVADFVRNYHNDKKTEESIKLIDDYNIDLRRKFSDKSLKLITPSEEEVLNIFRKINKFSKEDELNCGACGYSTCREKAIAVYNGLAEVEMCLPYMIEHLEKTLKKLEISYKELTDAQEQLVISEKLASIGQLAAGVAHQLNNPLGGVLLYAHLLMEELKAEDPMAEKVSVITKEADRCREIVRGLLDFARQNKPRDILSDINKIIDDVLEYIEKEQKFHKIKVIKELQSDIPLIRIDPTQIMQVFENIVNNAVEAMSGKGRLTITSRITPDGKNVEVSFADTGCGIPPENMSKLFSPFFTTKELGKGTGLGLAVAYGIVKTHRGSIDVKSNVGEGTTLFIKLPLNSSPMGEI